MNKEDIDLIAETIDLLCIREKDKAHTVRMFVIQLTYDKNIKDFDADDFTTKAMKTPSNNARET